MGLTARAPIMEPLAKVLMGAPSASQLELPQVASSNVEIPVVPPRFVSVEEKIKKIVWSPMKLGPLLLTSPNFVASALPGFTNA